MTRITREKLRAWDACYKDERIAELVPPEGLTVREVAALDIPHKDRVWAAVHALPHRRQVAFMCRAARRVLPSDAHPDALAAVELAERFAAGEDVPIENLRALTAWAWVAEAAVEAAEAWAGAAWAAWAWEAGDLESERAAQLADLIDLSETP